MLVGMVGNPHVGNVKCRLYWGATGSGKTYSVYQDESPRFEPAFRFHPLFNPFCRYQDEPVLVLDDLGGTANLSIRLLLHCLHGSLAFGKYKRVYITSAMHRDDWYPDATKEQRDWLRELLPDDQCFHLKGNPIVRQLETELKQVEL